MEDRRVLRTKRRLKAALFELMDERGYEAVTIRDLTERADVGRSTFYSHYGSKEDLLFAGFDGWLLGLADGPARDPAGSGPDPGGATAGFRFSRPLLEHARTGKAFFRATIAEAPDPSVRRRVVGILTEVARRELAARGRAAPDGSDARAGLAPEADLDARAHAVVGAFLGVLGWWLSEAEWVEVDAVEAVFQAAVASI